MNDQMQRARKLLAQEYRKDGFHVLAYDILHGRPITAAAAIRAVTAALAEKEAIKDRLLVALERSVLAETALRELADECENDSVSGWEHRMQSCLDHARSVLKAAPAIRPQEHGNG